jgi:hypothetical protein
MRKLTNEQKRMKMLEEMTNTVKESANRISNTPPIEMKVAKVCGDEMEHLAMATDKIIATLEGYTVNDAMRVLRSVIAIIGSGYGSYQL